MNFLTEIIDAHVAEGRYPTIVTRFPPEPNGYLHIGHAKSICLNFGLAAQYGGRCNLRMDDTNPTKEDNKYVESIQADVAWLGFEWGDMRYASDYFAHMYFCAQLLITQGKAYVDSCSREEIRTMRGTISEPGIPSPYRDRPEDESLVLFAEMRQGKHPEGSHVLRAKIDLSSPNMLMRDPILYRILHTPHHRTGHKWYVYPTYDFAHCLSDQHEDISHSICTLEFENNRELYDWVLTALEQDEPRPHQYEYARLVLEHTVLSKRKLQQLVAEGHVSGWDDPCMPTLAGLRRRGVTPSALRAFINMIGVAKTNSMVDVAKLDYCLREDLNTKAPRMMAVFKPLRLHITNVTEQRWLTVPDWPENSGHDDTPSTHKVLFGPHLLIEQTDFAIDPPKGWHRLAPGKEVRLRHAGIIRCDSYETDEHGTPTIVYCTLVDAPKAKGTIHWVCCYRREVIRVRLINPLFTVPNPDQHEDWLSTLNPERTEELNVLAEAHAANVPLGAHVQFERHGYFYRDPVDGTFNRVVKLRDSFTKHLSFTAP